VVDPVRTHAARGVEALTRGVEALTRGGEALTRGGEALTPGGDALTQLRIPLTARSTIRPNRCHPLCA
jgi:hypothetical protein